MLVNLVQYANALFPIVVTLFGIFMLVSPAHPENASSPIVVTLSGIFMLVSPVHPENASLPIVVTVLGISGDPIITLSPENVPSNSVTLYTSSP